MSLYYDASTVLTSSSNNQGGSFKSRIYNSKSLKASPAQIYALVTEASKWDILLKEVIENAGILSSEPKLTPLLCLLLTHDFLFSKNGIAAPASHPLRQAVDRHKVRLKAELTKARVRRNCASIQDLQSVILAEKRALFGHDELTESMHPRWVRINNVKSTFSAQMETSFSNYQKVDQLSELKSANQIYIDAHIPDLVALAPGTVDFSSLNAYRNGEIILQDKASCFPAYLLLGDKESPWDGGDLVDGCAAPGNKTTHLSSLLTARQKVHTEKKSGKSKIISMDASAPRSKILQKMVSVAGADKLVTVLAGQDFLALDPEDERFESVTGLLLDPSCSGSGIIGRDDVPKLILPEQGKISKSSNRGTKRKRPTEDESTKQREAQETNNMDTERLVKLSNLQTHIVEHALTFPAATRVTYSTCSIHILENECVVERVLSSKIAKKRGWRIMRRDEQPRGLRKWRHRGIRSHNDPKSGDLTNVDLTEEEIDACLRCWPGDDECTGGFFVAGFIRDDALAKKLPDVEENGVQSPDQSRDVESDSEWEGFSD
ncbi:NOL1/NOP2/sun domain protein, putative [Talaromyces stipitatus ATCC 10500]|uniref:NOL1/NOP2/sun domain protein, putative n=1 Tax=Talaromyces stipitatus (strain ATCC 10500 / CBS 375.48 / QM 6759 / NRRL 1006) TaxID=441959 RepID=B8M3I2_TALSN|nr:NOL1/NOP2/sun domain protein, putative [Talaromyces stipitatus ATCC 10500]EED22354.1 NOL1/NOP2/sun domain protein, putative [Talaromyces stipitatus ATCC 10500]